MHRTSLLGLLERYRLSNVIQREEFSFLDEIESFVQETPDCFKRENLPGHITGSALIVNAENNAVILMHHKKLGIWVQPGGHADGERDILEVALKEAQEETGMQEIYPLSKEIFDIDIHLIPAGKTNPPAAHCHYDIRFILQASAGSKIVKNKESLEVLWLSANEVREKTQDRAVIRLIEKWQKYFCLQKK